MNGHGLERFPSLDRPHIPLDVMCNLFLGVEATHIFNREVARSLPHLAGVTVSVFVISMSAIRLFLVR